MEYVTGEKERECVFCKGPKEKKDERNLIIYQGKYAFVVMNRFPYNTGHLMVVPKRHRLDIDELNDKEFQELFYLMKVSTQVLKRRLFPHGFNIGINIGKAGGAGKEHLHLHIVPRWVGDTNFMPAIGETRIIPEYLSETYQKLHSGFEDLLGREKGRTGGQKK